MDKMSSDVREYLAKRANLLGAIRLPTNSFANKEVTTDIIFLQKREQMREELPSWVKTEEYDAGVNINKYFIDHPEMVMGEFHKVSTQFGKFDFDVVNKNGNLNEMLEEAINKLPHDIFKQEERNIESKTEKVIPAIEGVKDFSYTLVNDKIYYRENAVMREKSNDGIIAERVKGLIKVRETLGELIDKQCQNVEDYEIEPYTEKLNKVYDDFVKKYGYLSNNANKNAFGDDSEYPLLTALEEYNEETKEYTKRDIFYKRTIQPYKEITHTETAEEALIASLNQIGKVDIKYISNLCNKDIETVIKDLKGKIFRNPMKVKDIIPDDITKGWETAEEYLSGYVVDKLAQARFYAEENEMYLDNVMALQEVQPVKLEASDIEINLGATWIPEEYITQFAKETLKIQDSYYSRYDLEISYNKKLSKWFVENKTYNSNIENTQIYGTKRITGIDLLEDTLNLKNTTIYDPDPKDPEGKKRIVNKKETILAREKQEALKERFKNWIFEDSSDRSSTPRSLWQLLAS